MDFCFQPLEVDSARRGEESLRPPFIVTMLTIVFQNGTEACFCLRVKITEKVEVEKAHTVQKFVVSKDFFFSEQNK